MGTLLEMKRAGQSGTESVLITDQFRCESDAWIVRVTRRNGILTARIADAGNKRRSVCYSFPALSDPEEVRSQAFDLFFDDQSAAHAAGRPFPTEALNPSSRRKTA